MSMTGNYEGASIGPNGPNWKIYEVGRILAENEALKARVAELEAQLFNKQAVELQGLLQRGELLAYPFIQDALRSAGYCIDRGGGGE